MIHGKAMALPRVQLFEFNDLTWMPVAVRDTIVESLSRMLEWNHLLDGVVAPFDRFLRESGSTEVLDLGSGAGGPARLLAQAIARAGRTPPRFLLTDLHPHLETWAALRDARPAVIDYVAQPVDATRIDPALSAGRARTIINVLHHFPPVLARQVLEDAVRGGHGVFVAEAFERNPLQFANQIPAGLPAMLANPILSPRERLAKAFLTWATPAAAAIALWDGIVSTLRVYTEAELRAMVEPFGAAFRWEYGTYPYWPFGRGYYFFGVPRAGTSGTSQKS